MGALHRLAALSGAVALLTSCAARPAAPARPASASSALVSVPPGQAPPGAPDAVLGRSAQALLTLFGQPALDVREGDARKLQFLNDSCVLDVYLYPRGGGDALVTHVDARLPDGRDADRAACIVSLQQR